MNPTPTGNLHFARLVQSERLGHTRTSAPVRRGFRSPFSR